MNKVFISEYKREIKIQLIRVESVWRFLSPFQTVDYPKERGTLNMLETNEVASTKYHDVNKPILIKRGDNGFGLKVALFNEDGKVDITDCNVYFQMGAKHKINCQIEDAINGIVKVYFEKVHTEKEAIYYGEFKVKFKDGRVETFPNSGYVKININGI